MYELVMKWTATLTLAFYEQLPSHKHYCFWHFLKSLWWFQCVLSDPVQCHIYKSKASKIYWLLEKRCNLYELHLSDLRNKNSNSYWCDLCLTWVKEKELLIAPFSEAQNSMDKGKKPARMIVLAGGWGCELGPRSPVSLVSVLLTRPWLLF